MWCALGGNGGEEEAGELEVSRAALRGEWEAHPSNQVKVTLYLSLSFQVLRLSPLMHSDMFQVYGVAIVSSGAACLAPEDPPARVALLRRSPTCSLEPHEPHVCSGE